MVYVCYVIYELVTEQCQMINVLVDACCLMGGSLLVSHTTLNLIQHTYSLMNSLFERLPSSVNVMYMLFFLFHITKHHKTIKKSNKTKLIFIFFIFNVYD